MNDVIIALEDAIEELESNAVSPFQVERNECLKTHLEILKDERWKVLDEDYTEILRSET